MLFLNIVQSVANTKQITSKIVLILFSEMKDNALDNIIKISMVPIISVMKNLFTWKWFLLVGFPSFSRDSHFEIFIAVSIFFFALIFFSPHKKYWQ